MRAIKSACPHTNKSPSVVAVQGLGAHKYYTWVKTKSSPTQQEKSKSLSKSDLIPRRRKIAPTTPESNNAAQSSDPAKTINNASVEVMWLRDLLPRFLPNARIATYSYKSDWRQDVKTNLRKCGEQLLNVLYQHRSSEKVSPLIFARCFYMQLILNTPAQEARRPLIFIGHSLGGLVIKQVRFTSYGPLISP